MNKWLMSNANILAAVSPLYYTSKVIGIAPISWPHRSRSPHLIKAYSLLVFISTLTCLIYSINWNVRNEYPSYTYTVIVPHIFKMLLSFATVLAISFLCGTVNGKKYEAILTKISAIDSILLGNAATTNIIYRKMKIFVLVELLVIIPIYLILFCLDGAVWTGGVGDPHALVQYFVHLIGTVMDMQFVNLVLLIKHRYALLNKQLISLYKVPENELEWTLLPIPEILTNVLNTKKSSKNEMPVLNTVSYRTEYGFKNVKHFPGKKVDNTVKRKCENTLTDLNMFPGGEKETISILNLQNVHSSLYDVAELVKSCYGIPILLELTFIVGSLIQSLYNVLLIALQLDKVETYAGPTEAMGLFLVWAIVRLIKMVCITTTCQTASSEANRTAILVQKLLLTGGTRSKCLERFSHQLLHYKLQFTTSGFFTLDSTLLYSLAGAVTTYLVILLQFQFVASSETNPNVTDTSSLA